MKFITDFLDWIKSPAEGVACHAAPKPAQPPAPTRDMSVRPFVSRIAECYERMDYTITFTDGIHFAYKDNLSASLTRRTNYELSYKNGRELVLDLVLTVGGRDVGLTDGEKQLFDDIDARLKAAAEAREQKHFDDAVAKIMAYEPRAPKPAGLPTKNP